MQQAIISINDCIFISGGVEVQVPESLLAGEGASRMRLFSRVELETHLSTIQAINIKDFNEIYYEFFRVKVSKTELKEARDKLQRAIEATIAAIPHSAAPEVGQKKRNREFLD